jgi:ABC-type transport system substrate-binding protein
LIQSPANGSCDSERARPSSTASFRPQRRSAYSNLAIRADGKEPTNGWADDPRIEELRAAWLETVDLEQQKRICADLQKQLWQDVPFIPVGEYWPASAYRKRLTDILPGCFATFYGVCPRAVRSSAGLRPRIRLRRHCRSSLCRSC